MCRCCVDGFCVTGLTSVRMETTVLMYPATGLYPDSGLHPDNGLDHTQDVDVDHLQDVDHGRIETTVKMDTSSNDLGLDNSPIIITSL